MKRMIAVCALPLAAVAVCSVGAPCQGAGEFTWGGIDAHPAVVNPVMACDPSNVVSLRGEWEFVAHPMNRPLRNGVWGRFYQETNWPGSRAITVTGSSEYGSTS